MKVRRVHILAYSPCYERAWVFFLGGEVTDSGDSLISSSENSRLFADELTKMTEATTDNIQKYAQSIHLYQAVGATLGYSQRAKAKVLSSLENTNEMTKNQISKSHEMVDFINESQSEIDDFLAIS